jgi:integrase
MKLKPNPKGIYYAHLTGSNPINLKTKSLDEAKRLARAAKLEELEFAAKTKMLTAEAVQRLCSGGKVTGKRALERWRILSESMLGLTPATRFSYEGHIKRFLIVTKLNDEPISTASFDHIDKFVNANDDTAVSTRNMRRASLDSFFKICSAEGFTIRNPAELTKVKMHGLTFEQKEPKVREPFNDLEIDQLRSIDDPFWRVAVRLSLDYGLRLSDVACLEWASLAKPGVLIVWTDKHDKRLELPTTPGTSHLFESVPRGSSRYVFPEQAEIVQDMKRRSTLSVYFSRHLKRLGIPNKSFHCLRHTFATRRAELGDSIDQIRLKMGHSSPDTTAAYVHN